MRHSLKIFTFILSILIIGACSNPNDPENSKLLDLTIEAPPTAVAGEPFTVIITATGASTADLNETVVLSVSQGTVTPATARLVGDRVEVDIAISGAAGTVILTAQAGDVSGSGTIRSLMIRTFTGDPGDPVAEHTPEIPYEPREEDYSTDHPEAPGMLISHNTMLMLPAVGASVGEMNALLADHDALVVGAIPGAVGVAAGPLMVRVPGNDHEAFDALLATLREDPRIAAAAQDVEITTTMEPRPQSGVTHAQGWAWGSPAADGNWGLELSRAPQMWNLNAALEKRGVVVDTGVVDTGFKNGHLDLALVIFPPNTAKDHGTHVAGTIGATFDNGRGVDGMNPFARLWGKAPTFGDFMLWGQVMFEGYRFLAANVPGISVVNMSLAYNWRKAGVDTDQSLAARQVASNHGQVFNALLDLQELTGRAPILVAAAGNDSAPGVQQARWASPMCNAALEHGNANIIVVESVSLAPGSPGSATRSAFSNLDGHIAAPGDIIVSTTASIPYNAMSGTSMAAPHVSGLIGYLLALDPSLTLGEIRQLLADNDIAVAGNASDRIDAFASALDIDRLRGNDVVLRMLCDIDDGSPDGNTRVDPFSGATVTSEDLDGDGGRGDGRVDMADFRRFRDWLLQVENPSDLNLDGSSTHPKLDVDGDSLVTAAADENVYPQADFNGDGQLSRTATAHVPGAINAARTDLAVLQHLFDDPDYAADDLPGLITSADLHVAADEHFSDPRTVEVRSRVEDSSGLVEERIHTPAAPTVIYTVPASGESYTAILEVTDSGGETIGVQQHVFEIPMPGEDGGWEPNLTPIALEVALPDEIPYDLATPVHVRAGLVADPGDTTFAAGLEVRFVADGGLVQPTQGETDATGRFSADVTIVPPATELILDVTVTTPDGSERTVTVVAEPLASDGPARLVGNSSWLAVTVLAANGGEECSDSDSFNADFFDLGPISESVSVFCSAGSPDCGTMENDALADLDITYDHDPGTGDLSAIRINGVVTAGIGGDFDDSCGHEHDAGASSVAVVIYEVVDAPVSVHLFGALGPLSDSPNVRGSIDAGFFEEEDFGDGFSVDQSTVLEPGGYRLEIELHAGTQEHDEALTGRVDVTLTFGE